MSSASAASFADASAPESASSVDGLTRSMLAMTLFNQAKGEYDALKASREAAADPDGALLKAFHERWAVQCHDFAVNHGGVSNQAAQLRASLQRGAGEAGGPREYVEALRPLTDRVPPRPFEAVAPVAEEELGQPLGELLASIDQTPIAAASLAQVHKGRLLDPNAKTRSAKGGKDGGGGGDVVAMKLQYPSLREQVEADFMVLQTMQTMAAPSGYDFSWLLADLQKYVTSELDFTTEAKNAMAAAEALRSLAPSVLVPRVVGELSATRVMATEFVEGLTRLDRPTELAALGLDRLEIGALAAAAFSELALVNGLVHGDPHSGNVYTRPLPGGGGGPPRPGSDDGAGAARHPRPRPLPSPHRRRPSRHVRSRPRVRDAVAVARPGARPRKALRWRPRAALPRAALPRVRLLDGPQPQAAPRRCGGAAACRYDPR